MRVAFGLKAHSGWAALVAIGKQDGEFVVVDRRRIELVEEEWAKQPYHAADDLKSDVARDLVKRGISAANRLALREVRLAVKREEKQGHQVVGCGVLVTDPMPDWSVDQILAVHFRMHKAEGALFREALSKAAQATSVRLVEIHEKKLTAEGSKALKTSEDELVLTVARLGKSVGPPWGKDQKESAIAAMIALQGFEANAFNSGSTLGKSL
jgi:hypothetical protein